MLYLISVSWGTVSGWWTFACLALAFLYSFFLYQQSKKLSRETKYSLFALRTIAVFTILFLLLSPLINTVSKNLQKPLIVILQDNSTSIDRFPSKNFKPELFFENLKQLKNALGKDYDVREFHFDKKIYNGFSDSLNGKQTDIANVLQTINTRFGNQNIGAVILVSDGLYNRGINPETVAASLKTTIYSVALGDTVPKKDVLIDHIDYNKTAFLGNDFLISVYIEAKQVKGNVLQLRLIKDDQVTANQQITVTDQNFKKTVSLKINADKKGIQQYQVNLQPVKGEISTENNSAVFYVEVIDNRKKILILYDAPHPDIAAIRQSLAHNQQYEVNTSLWSDFNLSNLNTYNLLILEQLPNNRVDLKPLLMQAERQKLPIWYFLGAQSNLQQFNSLQKLVTISSSNSAMQEVFAAPDASFTAFILSDSTRNKIAAFPPLLAPFGNYGSAGTSILLKQKIGTVNTTYPLLAFSEDHNHRTAVFTAEGLWRWRLNEFQQFGNHHAFDELISQSVQYLSVKSNQKRFNISVAKTIFEEDEQVSLSAELYNKSFELVNQPDVAITIKNKSGKKFSFQFSRSNQSYQLDAGILPPGEYNYEAQTKLGNENFKQIGNFSIKAVVVESAQSVANQQLMYVLAKENGGEMVGPEQLNTLPDLIRRNENIKTIAYQENSYKELIDEKWVFILIVLLLSLEWFLRRRNGAV